MLLERVRHILCILGICREYTEVEKILLDIRDGTRKFYVDRRLHCRVAAERGIIAKSVNHRIKEKVDILDISYGGACMRTRAYFKTGERLDIRIFVPLFAKPISVIAKVVRAISVPDTGGVLLSCFDVAVEFVEISTADNGRLRETVDILEKSRKRLLENGDKNYDIGDNNSLNGKYIDSSALLRKKYFTPSVRMLMQFIDCRDKYTRGHSAKVVRYAEKIAKVLNLDKGDILTIKCAALFHDIGKLCMETAILHKKGPLNEEEWHKVKKYPLMSARIMEQTGILDDEFINVIKHQHERFGGHGYPEPNMKGSEIPMGARILAVAEAYDAMTSPRPYRKRPMTREEAMSELRRCSGTQFDPEVVNAFIAVLLF